MLPIKTIFRNFICSQTKFCRDLLKIQQRLSLIYFLLLEYNQQALTKQVKRQLTATLVMLISACKGTEGDREAEVVLKRSLLKMKSVTCQFLKRTVGGPVL